MKNIMIIFLSFLSLQAYATEVLELNCSIDYAQEVVHTQAAYIEEPLFVTELDFDELGITVAPKNHPYYSERYLILNESLVRNYKMKLNGSIFTLTSNDKVLIDHDLNQPNKDLQISSDIRMYTKSNLIMGFSFFNPNTMKGEITGYINFNDRKLTNDFVTRRFTFSGTNYLDCQDKIEITTFKEYQQHWISLYEVISKQKAEYTKN